MDDTTALLVNISATFGAAAAGTWSAFMLEERRRKRERKAIEIAAGQEALVTLFMIWDCQKQHQADVIDKVREDPAAWLNLNATDTLGDLDRCRFDLRQLGFLVEAAPTLVQGLLLEEARFRTAALLVERHRELLFSEVFPRFQSAGIRLHAERSPLEFERALGDGVVVELKAVAGGIIRNVDQNVGSA